MRESRRETLERRLRADGNIRFDSVRVVASEHVRFGETTLVPANRTQPADELLQSSEWPNVRLLPLAVYQHTLIVTWEQLDAAETLRAKDEAGVPVVDWRHFQS